MSPLHDPREKTFEEVSGSLANAEAFTYSGNVQRTKVHRHTVEQLTFVVEASERPGAPGPPPWHGFGAGTYWRAQPLVGGSSPPRRSNLKPNPRTSLIGGVAFLAGLPETHDIESSA